MVVSVYFSVAGERCVMIHVFILVVSSPKTAEVLTKTIRCYCFTAVLNMYEV